MCLNQHYDGYIRSLENRIPIFTMQETTCEVYITFFYNGINCLFFTLDHSVVDLADPCNYERLVG